MNKKILLSLAILGIASICAFAGEASMRSYDAENEQLIHNPAFVKSLRTCTPYLYNGNTFIAQIVGIKNRECIYRGFSADGEWEHKFSPKELRDSSRFNEIIKTINYYSDGAEEAK